MRILKILDHLHRYKVVFGPSKNSNFCKKKFYRNECFLCIFDYFNYFYFENLTNFFNELETTLRTTNGKIIITGDMNLDLNSDSQHVLQYKSLLMSYYVIICNSNYTREQSKTTIDHIATNITDTYQHTILTCPLKKEDLFYSDHSILITFINTNIDVENDQTVKHVLNHRKIEIELNEKLDTHHLESHTNPNSLSNYIANVIETTIQSNMYKRKMPRLRKNVCEWMNYKVQKLIKEKDLLKREKQRSPTQENIHRFSEISKELEKVKKNARQNYYGNLFKNSRDTKSTWKNINKLLGRSKKSNTCIRQLKHNNQQINDPNEIVNALNNHFATIGVKMASQIQTLPTENINHFNTLFYNHNTIDHQPTCLLEVKKIIRELKTGKSPGYDNLTATFVKQHSYSISKAVVILFNMSLEQGKFPDNLKIAKIIPIDKGGLKEDPSNYRPISLLPIIGKILEKLIYARINKYLEEQKFITKYQYGFRKKCNTTVAATELVIHLQTAMDN